jgi:hypothetical protein
MHDASPDVQNGKILELSGICMPLHGAPSDVQNGKILDLSGVQ